MMKTSHEEDKAFSNIYILKNKKSTKKPKNQKLTELMGGDNIIKPTGDVNSPFLIDWIATQKSVIIKRHE